MMNKTMTAVFCIALLWPTVCPRPRPAGQLPWLKGQEPKLKAYDCSEVFDVRNIEYHKEKTCINQDDLYTSQRNVTATIIQDTQHEDMPAIRCRLRKAYTFYHCGMFSHVTPISYLNAALMPTTLPLEDCRRAHESGYLKLDDGDDYNVETLGKTTLHVETRGGTWLSGGSGTCWGEKFSTQGAEFNSGIEYTELELEIEEITLQLHRNRLHVKHDRAVLPCPKEQESCETSTATYIWQYGKTHCSAARTNTFRGLELTDQKKKKMVHSTDGNFVRLTLGEWTTLCGHKVITTNIDNVYIVYDYHENATSWANSEFSFDPLSIQNYVMDRDDFIIGQLHKEITDVYAQVSNHRCIADDILKARYPLLTGAPAAPRQTWQIEGNLFGQHAGQSFYTYKCKELLVVPRATTTCYDRLPVHPAEGPRKNVFIDPDTHRIRQHANIMPCPEILFIKYKDITGKWIASAKTPFHTMAPNTFHVRSPIFKVDHIIVGGLVSNQIITDAAERLNFGDYKEELINHLVHVVHDNKRSNMIRTSKDDLLDEAKDSVKDIGSSLFSPIGNWIKEQEMILLAALGLILAIFALYCAVKVLHCCTDPVECCVDLFICCFGNAAQKRDRQRNKRRRRADGPSYKYRADLDTDEEAMSESPPPASAPPPPLPTSKNPDNGPKVPPKSEVSANKTPNLLNNKTKLLSWGKADQNNKKTTIL